MFSQIYAVLRGRLDERQVEAVLSLANLVLEDIEGDAIFTVDCREMTRYTTAARDSFMRWHKEHGDKIQATVVITDRLLWQSVVTTMGMATRRKMRAFSNLADAEAWLGTRIEREVPLEYVPDGELASSSGSFGSARVGGEAPRSKGEAVHAGEGHESAGDSNSEPQIRGFFLKSTLDILSDAMDRSSWVRERGRLEARTELEFVKLGNLTWYPASALRAVVEAYAATPGSGEGEDGMRAAAESLGRRVFRRHVDSALSLSLEHPTPADLGLSLPRLWTRYVLGMRSEVTLDGAQTMHCSLSRPEGEELLAWVALGWFAAAMSRGSGANVEPDLADEGASPDALAFTLSWDAA